MADPTSPLPFLTRLWFAWACFFRVLFDGDFAARAFAARSPAPALPERKESKAKDDEPAARAANRARVRREASMTSRETPLAKAAEEVRAEAQARATPALQLLALLQREGRLIDFLQQDVTSFSDADIGSAARAVHDGCRKALRQHMKFVPIRSEEEETKVTLDDGFDAREIKLTGRVTGKAPYSGVLKHRGWRAKDVALPVPAEGHDPAIVCQAEVEL